jgi:hypothetical protein
MLDQTDLLSPAAGLSRPGAWEAMRAIVVGVLLERAVTAAICSSIPRHTTVPGIELPIALPGRTSRCCDLLRLALPSRRSECGPTGATGPLSHTCERHRRPGNVSRRLGGSRDRARKTEQSSSLGRRHITLRSTLLLCIDSLVGVFAPHMRLPTRHNNDFAAQPVAILLPADNAPAQHATRRQNGASRWKVSHLFMSGAEKLERDRQGSLASRADLMHACSPRPCPPCTSTFQRAIAATVSLVFTHSSLDAVPVCHAPGRHPIQGSTSLPFPGTQGVGSTSMYHKPRLVIGLSRDVCLCTFGTFVICTIAVRG